MSNASEGGERILVRDCEDGEDDGRTDIILYTSIFKDQSITFSSIQALRLSVL